MKLISANKLKFATLLFLLIFFISSLWAMTTPAGSEAPDESQHIELIYFLKSHQRIPIFDRETDIVNHIYSKTSFGFVYYSMAYNSPVGYLPFLLTTKNNSSDKISNILSSRLISVLEIALFSVFLFLTLVEINRKKILAAFTTAITISLIPQINFSGSYVNLEPFSLLISAITLFLFIRIRNKISANLWELIILGFFLGILGLCKANYYILIFYFGLLVLADFFSSKNIDKKVFIKNYLVVIATFVLVNSWWWIRNFRLYRDPLILTYIRKELIDKAPDWVNSPSKLGYNFFSIFKIPGFTETTFKGFYGYLGGLSVLLPSYLYTIAAILLLCFAILCLINKSSRQYLYFFLITSVVALVYYINKNLYDYSPQGRHLFPLVLPLAIVVFIGISNLKLSLQKIFSSLLIIYSALISFYALLSLINQYYVYGTAYRVGAIRIIERFSWHHLTFSELARLLNFIFIDNHAFSTIFFFVLVIIAIILLLTAAFIVQYWRDETSLVKND